MMSIRNLFEDKIVHCSRVVVVTELIVSETQCTFYLSHLWIRVLHTVTDLVWKFKILACKTENRYTENTNVRYNQNALVIVKKETLQEFDLELGRK